MIDLHCHLLPGIDDGAPDAATAAAMARLAIADGIKVTACTPHIYPGLYENTRNGILAAVTALRKLLDDHGLALELSYGADTHLVPGLLEGLRGGRIPTLNGSRYFLLEPPHHVCPPRLEESCFSLMTGGYVPIITHPERLTWIDDHFAVFRELAHQGVWMQVTAGSLVGEFGTSARYWGERLLDEGLVHLLATDAHGTRHRRPHLSRGRDAAARWLGAEEAGRLVLDRPQNILDDLDAARVIPPPGLLCPRGDARRGRSFWKRVFGG